MLDIKISPRDNLTLNLNVTVSGRLDHHLHCDGLVKPLAAIGEAIMANAKAMKGVSDDLKALLVGVRDGLNKVAAKVADLSGRVKNSMTDDELTSIKNDLSDIGSQLNNLGETVTPE